MYVMLTVHSLVTQSSNKYKRTTKKDNQTPITYQTIVLSLQYKLVWFKCILFIIYYHL